MRTYFKRFFEIVVHPDTFFDYVREERNWRKPLVHLAILTLWLSLGSVTAWGFGIAGDTPINASLSAQMDIYPYWQETLLPQYGLASYPMAMGLIILEMVVITAIWTPVVFLVFRFLGGAKESGGLLRAFQGFVYGLTPCAFGGFIPYLALFAGVYATLLQFGRGPALTLRNRTAIPYLFTSLFLALAIVRYWQRSLF
ncbi:MAG: hypothetical protein JXR84_10760 [Anaerolineae bacterium]|nr:hypothetical protein [Anaerolineae bacterium]